MKAIVYDAPGDATVLHIEERPIPNCKANEVLIKVVGAGINRPDIFQRIGRYPAPHGVVQDIPGLEVAGIIEQVGKDVKHQYVGQQVCALVPGGGYAEYVAVDAGSCLPKPSGISLEDAAALPETLFTVWHNIFQRGKLKPGEDVFIYGGSGGIGSMAIQLVNLYGSRAYTMASSIEKELYCISLGAIRVVKQEKCNILEVLGENSMDVVLDSVGGEYLDVNLNLLRTEGRLIYINAMNGNHPSLNIMKVMQKRLHITGSTLRNRSYSFKKELAQDIIQNAYPLIESPQFKSLVNYTFPMEKVVEAHQLMESREFTGKIILLFNQ